MQSKSKYHNTKSDGKSDGVGGGCPWLTARYTINSDSSDVVVGSKAGSWHHEERSDGQPAQPMNGSDSHCVGD